MYTFEGSDLNSNLLVKDILAHLPKVATYAWSAGRHCWRGWRNMTRRVHLQHWSAPASCPTVLSLPNCCLEEWREQCAARGPITTTDILWSLAVCKTDSSNRLDSRSSVPVWDCEGSFLVMDRCLLMFAWIWDDTVSPLSHLTLLDAQRSRWKCTRTPLHRPNWSPG